MRNAEYYPSPTTYRPERWVENAAEGVRRGSVELAQSAFSPFSVGPRECVARPLAHVELTLALGWVPWGFAVRVEPGPGSGVGEQGDGTYRLMDFLIAEKREPMVQFRVRERVEG